MFTHYWKKGIDRHRKRAVVAVQVGIMMTVLLGVAALTIDVGQLYSARNDLQRAADSAALAGASALTTDDMMDVRLGGGDLHGVVTEAVARASEYSYRNDTLNVATTVETGDVLTGQINLNSGTEAIDTAAAGTDYNAVQVSVFRNAAGSNGAVTLFFSSIFGRSTADSLATAVAAFDDRFAGFATDTPGSGISPFSMSRDAYNQDYFNGPDNYSYDEIGESVFSGADGTREIRIYPYPYSGTGYVAGDGNFGMLNIGNIGQGSAQELNQITNGVSGAEFEAEIGTSDMTFYDDSGSNLTYDVTGSPGLSANIESTLEGMVGQVIGFFLHDSITEVGANTTYTMSDLRFGRIMSVRLRGQPSERGVYIQPVTYVGNGVRTSPNAPSSNGQMGRIMLVR